MQLLNVMLLSSSASGSNTGTDWWTLILFPVVMFGALWLFAIRPQKKKDKQTAQMRNSIDIGDLVTTVGGITGRVVNVRDEEDELIIETGSDKTKIRIKRWAIATREEEPEEEESESNTTK